MRGFPLVAVLGVAFLLTGCGSQQLPSAPSKEPAVQTTASGSDGTAHTMSACTVSGLTAYSQHNASWSSILLGNSGSDTIGAYGCVITDLAMYYTYWGVSTTPSQMNTSAKNGGCFAPGSSLVDVNCAINTRGGPKPWWTFPCPPRLRKSVPDIQSWSM